MRPHSLVRKALQGIAVPLALLAPYQLGQAQEADRLQIQGSLVTNRSFALKDLATLPQTEIAETKTVRADQQQDTRLVKYHGVLLRTVLNASDFQEKDRHDFRKAVIIARARDGYVALFTWAELFNSRLGDSILVVTDIDGRKLPETEGPYALRSFGDIKPGPRHVKWLQQIEVIKAVP